MAVLRSEIERALNEIVSNEEGMSFPGFATLLAKQRWPELIACERNKDLDHDFREVETLPENDGVRSTIGSVAQAKTATKTASSRPKSRAKRETKAADQAASLGRNPDMSKAKANVEETCKRYHKNGESADGQS